MRGHSKQATHLGKTGGGDEGGIDEDSLGAWREEGVGVWLLRPFSVEPLSSEDAALFCFCFRVFFFSSFSLSLRRLLHSAVPSPAAKRDARGAGGSGGRRCSGAHSGGGFVAPQVTAQPTNQPTNRIHRPTKKSPEARANPNCHKQSNRPKSSEGDSTKLQSRNGDGRLHAYRGRLLSRQN